MSAGKTILVTGGAGYVGSHCVLELLLEGYKVVVIDNCCNAVGSPDGKSLPESLKRVEKLADLKIAQYEQLDLHDTPALDQLFGKFQFDAVIHFAALKAVGESCAKPLDYHWNNVAGTLNLLRAVQRHATPGQVLRFIFSSSATVYGAPEYLPIDEKHPTGRTITNPYGRTKYLVEEILKDLCATSPKPESAPSWSVASLRYFNPVGSHISGEIGEDPQGVPNNLMPFISQVAVGKRAKLSVFGSDFDTPDGTGVRDYIHISDLSRGHVVTLKDMFNAPDKWQGFVPLNLGTGRGISVLEMVNTFQEVNGVPVPYVMADRRPGDVATVYSDASLAEKLLGWRAEKTFADMCRDTWRWQSKYPNGFRS